MDFSDSHAGINFLVRDTHPDKTIMLMSFSFFSDFKVLLLLLFFEKQNMNAEGMHTLKYVHTHTHTLKSVVLLISPLHICLLAVCVFSHQ